MLFICGDVFHERALDLFQIIDTFKKSKPFIDYFKDECFFPFLLERVCKIGGASDDLLVPRE